MAVAEDTRDSTLDDRIMSWLNSIEAIEDFSALTEKPQDVYNRPCMNCSMRGGRSRPNILRMDIPSRVLRGSGAPKKEASSKPSQTMEGVRSQRPQRGKGRGRQLKEKVMESISTEKPQSTSKGTSGANRLALIELAQTVDSLSDEELGKLRVASSYARGAKNDNQKLREILRVPPKEVSLNCWVLVIEISLGRKSVDDLVNYPLKDVLATCVAFEADSTLHEVLLNHMEQADVAYAMYYLTENSWLSSSSGEFVCTYLCDRLGITTDVALDAMRTESGGYSHEGLDAIVKNVQSQTSEVCSQSVTDMDFLEMLMTQSVPVKSDSHRFDRRSRKPAEINYKSKEEFPELTSSVTVKKNMHSTKKDAHSAEKTNGDPGLGGSVSLDQSKMSSSEILGHYMMMTNLPEDCTKDILEGIVAAYGEVTRVEKDGSSAKVWFDDPSSLDWAVQALNELNPLTGDHDENIKCVLEGGVRNCHH